MSVLSPPRPVLAPAWRRTPQQLDRLAAEHGTEAERIGCQRCRALLCVRCQGCHCRALGCSCRPLQCCSGGGR